MIKSKAKTKKQKSNCPICGSTFLNIHPAGECNVCFQSVCGHCLDHDNPEHNGSICQECLVKMSPYGRLKEKEPDELFAILEDSSSKDCHLVARLLGDLSEPAALSPLCRALKSERLDVRRESVTSLGKLGNEKAIPHLVEVLNDPAPVVRSRAALALAELDAKEALEPLTRQLDDSSRQAAGNAVRALGKLMGKEASNQLKTLIQNHKSTFIKCEALTVLIGLDHEMALDAALVCLHDQKKELALTACKSRTKLNYLEAVPELKKLMDTTASASIRINAQATLIKLLNNDK